jgi:hypothetical protein
MPSSGFVGPSLSFFLDFRTLPPVVLFPLLCRFCAHRPSIFRVPISVFHYFVLWDLLEQAELESSISLSYFQYLCIKFASRCEYPNLEECAYSSRHLVRLVRYDGVVLMDRTFSRISQLNQANRRTGCDMLFGWLIQRRICQL